MTSNTNSGVYVMVTLTLIFVVLKLAHLIDWSWWWVLSPVWIAGAAAVAGLLVLFVMLLTVSLLDGRRG